ncbi:hypothetical protein SEA_MEDIUMFRY_11 [Arthrobacter phage MediumFry]|nr:hypothetical protein SEA_CATERPILLAR_11 [Arthrobacter phage Caterpillar]AXH44557.1 hypothetical protein SEA_MEDIUMFRY_11 [Arthrobacter phage MediumFry]
MTTEVVDNYLEHYGVKGMKWGKRSGGSDSSSGGEGKKSRKELRKLDREHRKSERAKARKEWDDEVMEARNELDGKAQKLNEASKQYKIDKHTMGKAAAKDILRKHEQEFIETWNVASLQTTKEANRSLVIAAGTAVLSAALLGASAASGR